MSQHPFRFLGALCVLPLVLCGTAQATIIEFTASLSGAAESPANSSTGTGTADIFYNDTTHMMEVMVSFSNLVGVTTASHIHAATALPGTGTAGVATETPYFEGFPIGVTSGTYDDIFDLTLASSFNPAYVTAKGSVAAAEAALVTAMLEGKAYLNIHTKVYPGGEIRGFLAKVPDGSSTALLLALGLFALFGYGRRMG